MPEPRTIRSNSRHGNFKWYLLTPHEDGRCSVSGRKDDSGQSTQIVLLATCDSYQLAFDWLVDINGHPIEQEASMSVYGDLIDRARAIYANEEINIDDDAELSEADDGCWVQGWLWVENEEEDDLEENEDLDEHEDASSDDEPFYRVECGFDLPGMDDGFAIYRSVDDTEELWAVVSSQRMVEMLIGSPWEAIAHRPSTDS